MKIWKLLYSEGASVGVAVVRAETAIKAIEYAREFGNKEGLMTFWLEHAEAIECSEEPGVMAWGES